MAETGDSHTSVTTGILSQVVMTEEELLHVGGNHQRIKKKKKKFQSSFPRTWQQRLTPGCLN